MTLLSAIVVLLLVVDPLGNLPTFRLIIGEVKSSRWRTLIIREHLIAAGVLLLFLFCGPVILAVLGVSQPSLGIAGGIILFMIALRMVFFDCDTIFVNDFDGEPLIVPLAIPLLAGPSSISTVILFMAKEPNHWSLWAVAILVTICISATILSCADHLIRLLGKKLIQAIQRLMGLILTAVAVEMFLSGIRSSLLMK